MTQKRRILDIDELLKLVVPMSDGDWQTVFKDEPDMHAIIQREKRTEFCQHIMIKYDFDTGGYTSYRHQCDVWRMCEYCFTKRVNIFKDMLELAQERHGPITILKITDKEWSSLRRKGEGKDWYRKTPVISGDNILFVNPLAIPGVNLSKYQHIDQTDLDWSEVANTPERKRYSGNLGKPITVSKPDEPSIVLEHAACVFDFSDVQETVLLKLQAEQQALEICASDPIPDFDKRELEQMLAKCNYLYQRHLLEHGCRIKYRITVKEKMTVSQYQESIRNKLTDILRESIMTSVPTKLGQDCLFAIHGLPID